MPHVRLGQVSRFVKMTCHLTSITILILAGCTYRVNSLVDAPDANPGDFTCAREIPEGTRAAGAADDGACTLRAAIMEANALMTSDRIEVPPGEYRLVLPSDAGGGQLEITEDVTIQGAGADATIVDGTGSHRVFVVDGADVAIDNLTIRGGGQNQGGSGLYVGDATLELNDAVVRDNDGFSGGGGIYVRDDATVTVRRSAILDNSATGAFGGGIWNQGELWVHESVIADNESNRAGGIRNSGQMNLRNTTVSGNRAHSPEAGTGGISQTGFAVLYNVTVTDNTGVGNNPGSNRGGGIQTSTGDTTVVKNSIIAGNHGGLGPDDCVGPLSGDSRNNLIGDTEGCEISSHVGTYLLDVDPLIGGLAANGGPTEVHEPVPGSPVIGAGYPFPPPAADACEAFDQRGVPRPQGDGVCDMGAVEVTSADAFVSGFVLVDAATDGDIRPLLHGDVLDLSELPSNLSVRAVVDGSPASVVFAFDGDSEFQTENLAPYALGGDSSGDFSPVALAEGTYQLQATPFAGPDGSGAAGGSRTISFEVVD